MRSKILFCNNVVHPTVTSTVRELSHHKEYEISLLIASGKRMGSWNYSHLPAVKVYHPHSLDINLPFLNTYTLHINYSALKLFEKIQPDILIVMGWDIPMYWMALYYALRHKKKIILINGSTEFEKSIQRFLFRPMVKFFIKNTDAFITYGTRSTKYLISLGAIKKKIFQGIYPADTASFQTPTIVSKQKLRNKLHISDKLTFLYVGQIIKRKNLLTLIKAFKHVSDKANLILVGDGDLVGKLKKYIQTEAISNVTFFGPLERSDLTVAYQISDVFVLPSTEEVWGLVVNEAMFFSLPLIVSNRCGCVSDLIHEGINGFTFQPLDVDALVQLLDFYCNSQVKIAKMGEFSKHIITKCTPKGFAQIHHEAIQYVQS